MFNKKILIIIGFIIITIISVATSIPKPKTEDQKSQPEAGRPLDEESLPEIYLTPPAPVTPAITIVPGEKRAVLNNIEINNILKVGKEANRFGDRLLVNKKEYQILFFAKTSEFLISILVSPFEKTRLEAEGEFLKVVGTTEEKACLLKVSITTPRFANPNEAGKVYKLSYCK